MISLEGMTSLEILSLGRNRIKNLQVSLLLNPQSGNLHSKGVTDWI